MYYIIEVKHHNRMCVEWGKCLFMYTVAPPIKDPLREEDSLYRKDSLYVQWNL